MAERTEGSITIEASPEAILDVITDFEAYPEWADIKATEVRARDDQGRPAEVFFEVAAGPINARYTLLYEYTPTGLSWTFGEGSGLKNLEGEYILEPDGDATHVRYSLTVDVNIPGPGFVKRKLLAEGEKRIVDTALKGLKQRVESR